MYRKQFFFSLAIAAMMLLGSLVASAQTGQLRGKVLMIGADGKEAPAVGAQVDVYRTDIGGKWNSKTDKKGEFVFAGLPYVGTYVVAISAPNARPDILAGVKAGKDIDYKLTLQQGDGRRLTEAEAKGMASAPNTTGGGSSSGESAEDRKKREELEAKNREIAANNAKITNINETLTRTFKAGNEATAAKRFDDAIAQYKEGLAADPEQNVLWTRLSIAYRLRGAERYNAASKLDEAQKKTEIETAAKDFREAADAAAKAVALVKAAPAAAATDPSEMQKQKAAKLDALEVRREAMRVLVKYGKDYSQAEALMTAYQEYLAEVIDPAQKIKFQTEEADLLLDAQKADLAYAEYQKILTANPDNLDATIGAGLSLINVGYMSGDKAKLQEGINYLQRFADKAPDTDKRKLEAKTTIEELKKAENITPQKTPSGRRRG